MYAVRSDDDGILNSYTASDLMAAREFRFTFEARAQDTKFRSYFNIWDSGTDAVEQDTKFRSYCTISDSANDAP